MFAPAIARRRMLAVLITASLALLAAPAAGAHAATGGRDLSAPSLLQNQGTGDCLTTDGEGSLFGGDCENRYDRLWTSGSGGEIRNIGIGSCLEDFGNGDVSAVDCNEGPRQQWETSRNELRNRLTGACVADGDGFIYTTSCDNYPSEKWDLVKP